MLLVRLCRLRVPRQWGESALKRGSCAPRCVGRCRAWSPSQAPRCVRLDRAPRCRRLRGASTELLRAGFKACPAGLAFVGGLEPRRCSRPVRDAAPQSLPQSSAVTGSRPTLALVYMLGQLQRIQPDALDAPDFVGIGAKPTREDGQRGRRNGGGSPWVPCQLARPRPRWTT